MVTNDWTILRHRLREDCTAVLLLWALFVLGVAALGLAIEVFAGIRVSIWEQASQLPRWFAGAFGAYFTAVYLPLYIAHGQTRREFAAQIPIVAVIVSGLLAVVMTVGYALERLVYGLADIPQTLTTTHLYDAPDQYQLIFIEFWLLFVLWTVAGALLGGAFYRANGLGFLILPLTLLLIGSAEAAIGDDFLGPLPPLMRLLRIEFGEPSLLLAVVVTLGGSLVAAALCWLVIRDLPIRSKAA